MKRLLLSLVLVMACGRHPAPRLPADTAATAPPVTVPDTGRTVPAWHGSASLTPARLVILPRHVALDTGASVLFCGYVLADDDTLRLLQQSAGESQCRKWYDDSFPDFNRGHDYPVAYRRKP